MQEVLNILSSVIPYFVVCKRASAQIMWKEVKAQRMLAWENLIFYTVDLSGDGVADQPSNVISATEAEARTPLIAQRWLPDPRLHG